MNNNRLQDLYNRYLTGNCTLKELQELKQLLRNPENDQPIAELLDTTWEELKSAELVDIPEPKANDIYFTITANKQKKPGILQLWYQIAAISVIFLSFTIAFYLFNRHPQKQNLTANKTVTESTYINPGSNKAILTLANGKNIILDEAVSGQIIKQKNMIITKVKNGEISYAAVSSGLKNAAVLNQFNTITIPKGGQYSLKLSDGTRVYLNSESSLTYPIVFAGDKRIVTLKGEAYFEVAKNSKMPFNVNVDNKQNIEVLGTHFNVEAYTTERAIKTTLLEGSVKIISQQKEIILKPGEMAVDNHTQYLLVKKADIEEVMAWKNGLFIFSNENITSIIKKISRWYNVDVVFQGNLDNINFTGNYARSKSLTNLLKNIELMGKVRFRIEERRITVIGK